MTADEADQALTQQQIVLFGTIVQWFASYELTVAQAVAGVVGTDLSRVAILMRGLDLAQKRRRCLTSSGLIRPARPLGAGFRASRSASLPHPLAGQYRPFDLDQGA